MDQPQAWNLKKNLEFQKNCPNPLVKPHAANTLPQKQQPTAPKAE